MKYINAKDILPKELLRQLQNCAGGKIIYVPTGKEKRSWGEASGYKMILSRRNDEIRESFGSGVSIEKLAEEYYLSVESIKKIVYSKKIRECRMEQTVENNDNIYDVKRSLICAYEAMREMGYDPVNQLVGFVITGDSGYITSNKDARSFINKLDIDDILREIFISYF